MKNFYFLLLAMVMSVINAVAGTVTFDFVNNTYGLERKSGNAADGYLEDGQSITSDGVTLTFTGGWRLWTDGLREYSKTANTTFTVSADGKPIKAVSWTVNSGAKFALEGTSEEITSWTGSTTSVKFVSISTGNAAVKTITVNYGEDDGTDTPVVPEIPDAPEGTINVATALDLISKGYEGEATVEGYIVAITEVSTQYGNATYDIADELEGGKTLKVFRGYYLDGEKFSATDQIKVGGKVVVFGSLTNYNGTYEFTTGNKILEYTSPVISEDGEDEEDEDDSEEGVTLILNVNDATDIEGTFVEETYKSDGSVQAAAHYQPLESLKIGDYTFKFTSTNSNASSQPAYYYATSTNTNQQKTIRIYDGTSMTILAPANTAMTKIEFNGSNLGSNASFTINQERCTWTWDGNNAVWTGNSTGFIVTANATWRFTELTITTAEIDDQTTIVDKPMIDDVNKDESSAMPIYYNLQGIRVMNPTSGLYIKHEGNKVSKVIIK